MGRGSSQLSECYPYGLAAPFGGIGEPRIVCRAGDQVIDLAAASAAAGSEHAPLLGQRNLDGLLAAGRPVWEAVHREAASWADAPPAGAAHHSSEVRLLLPFTVADYVDFYASEHHARRLGEMLRPGQEPLPANWRHQPIGYHGRSGTVVVSGTPVRRPHGHVAVDGMPQLRPTARLDVEVEVGYVVGTPSAMGTAVPVSDVADHVFGLLLVNDWSARDIQAWETVPLGPFLGKSFQTSVSPWVVPLTALDAARIWPPSHGQDGLSAYLVEDEPWGLDLSLELRVNGELVSSPPYRTMHWSPAQLLAHLTANGASLRTGDLFASGTVSGVSEHEVGSLIERWRGDRFLADGDEVSISGTAPDGRGGRLDLGEVTGRVVAADR